MNALTIDIRPAEIEDAQQVSLVHDEAWQQAYAGIIPHKALRTMLNRRDSAWWDRAIGRGTSVLVIDMGDQIAGYATFGLNRARALPQDGEIYELYIKPEYQGVGLGHRLFKSARRALDDHGCKGLVVWALEENEIACRFYRSHGGLDIGEGHETFDGKALKKLAFTWD